MLFRPDRIIACPRCGALERVFTLRSSNNLFSSSWTDGLVIMPMAWEPPDAARCHACSGYFWLEDASNIGIMSERDCDLPLMFPGEPATPSVPENPKEWEEAPHVRGLSMEEAVKAAGSEIVSSIDQEIRLRMLAFWASSHKNRNWRRKKTRQKTPLDKRNMAALIALHERRFNEKVDPEDAAAAAEIERQSGNFEVCLAWLRRIEAGGHQPERARVIRDCAEVRDIAVALVPGAGRSRPPRTPAKL